MTQQRSELLEKAIAKLSSLPLEELDRFASEILADLADEANWDRIFASDASQSWLSKKAEEVRRARPFEERGWRRARASRTAIAPSVRSHAEAALVYDKTSTFSESN
jgi:hypothetical protein